MHTAIRFGVVLSLCFLAWSAASAERFDTLWTRTYWNGYFDSANCVQQTADGGFIITGVSILPGATHTDIGLIKTDANGVVEWSKRLGDSAANDCGFHVLQTYDGGYLVSAQSDLLSHNLGKIWILKTDAAGDTVWTYFITESNGNGYPLWAIRTLDSGYAITGIINYSYDDKAFIQRLSRDGANEGFYAYGSYSHQDGTFIDQLPDSGFIVGGNYNNPYSTYYDYWAFRTDKTGAVIWDSIYAISGSSDIMYGGCRVDDGMVMVGLKASTAHAIRVDLDGHTVWSKSISIVSGNEKLTCVCPTPDGGFMVGGWVGVTGYRRDYCFQKLNADGDTLSYFTVGGGDDDHGRSLVPTTDGNYAMVGSSSSFVNGTCLYLVKTCNYLCGDAGDDGIVNVADAVYLINYIFRGGPAPLGAVCRGDVNGDGITNVGDAVYIIAYVFRGGQPPIETCCR